MRLSKIQIEIIKEGVHQCFGSDARVWLFGSRTDDLKKGGDIDIYIETSQAKNLLDARLKLMTYFVKTLGEQKIDIVVRSLQNPKLPIHNIALATGIELI